MEAALTRRRAVAGLVVVGSIVLAVLLTEGGGTRHHPPRAPVPQPAPATSAVQLGANVGRLFNGSAYGASFIATQLAGLEATGATLARSDAQWELSEPAAPTAHGHRYDWQFDDTLVAALATHHLRWLPILDYSPQWARSTPGQDHSPPTSPDDYAAFAAALAARYGAAGAFWRRHPALPQLPVDTYEVWNEPDNPAFWKPAPDPAAYDALYERALAQIGAVQPAARVLVGGLTNPSAFLSRLLTLDPRLRTSLGGVAIHPYAPTPGAVLAKVRADRLLLRGLGAGGVPLFVTEVGWTTSPSGALDYAPASARPGYLQQTIAALAGSDCDVAAVLVYAWFTPERDPSNPQDWFGIDGASAAGSPDVAAFTTALRSAGPGGPPSSLCAG